MTLSSRIALLLLALSPPATAWLKSTRQESWHPAKETVNIGYRFGSSPRPTDGPQARFGRMGLHRRLDGYTLGADTCGFEAGNGNPLTCIHFGYTCSFTDSHVGCCDPTSCSHRQTSCIDYSASRAGSCTGKTDVLCCDTSSEGACFTYYISTTAADDTYDTFTVLDCSAASGTGILLDYDPLWSRAHFLTSSQTSTSGTSATSSTSKTATETGSNNSGGGSSTPAGAIAGGVVGGVAALALVAIAVFLLLRRRGDNPTHPQSGAAHTSPQQPPMGQQGPYPQGVYTAGYPIQGPHAQEQYDPRISTFNQHPLYPNTGQNYQGHHHPSEGLPEQQMFQHTGHSAGSPAHNASFGGYRALSITTSTEQQGAESTPSPGKSDDITRETTSPGRTNELEAVAPFGMEANRAELGGTNSPP